MFERRLNAVGKSSHDVTYRLNSLNHDKRIADTLQEHLS
nr:MAG TPA: hypothetical protein [Caudoviricetes sp.]